MNQEFERVYEASSVPGYMERLLKEITSRLMAKGFSVNLLMGDGENFVLRLTDFRHHTGLFHVKCVNNSIIEWRKYA